MRFCFLHRPRTVYGLITGFAAVTGAALSGESKSQGSKRTFNLHVLMTGNTKEWERYRTTSSGFQRKLYLASV